MAEVARILSSSTQPVPYYLGTVTNKRATTQGAGKNTHAHYVLINPTVAKRLGMPAKSTIKKTDEFVSGAVFDTKRKYKDADNKTQTTDAKRYIQPMSKQVELFTGDYVKIKSGNKKGKLEQESYTVGFPSTLSITEILFFVHKKMPKVKLVRSGKKSYRPKNIVIPKDNEVVADAGKEAK
jgi:hypothetical protein